MEQVSMNTALDSLSNAINDLEYHLKYSSYKIAPEMQERILKVGTKFREYVAGKQTPNPMIEGDGKLTDEEVKEAYDKWYNSVVIFNNLGIWKAAIKWYKSQPIVKGEGKWSKADMLAAWTEGTRQKEFTVTGFLEWLLTYVPSPEKQEEGLNPEKQLNIISLANQMFQEPKPDGIEQREKGHNQAIADIIQEIKRSPAIVSEQKYNEWYKRLLAISQPKAPDITEGEIKRIANKWYEDYHSENGESKNEYDAIYFGIKEALQHHPKAQPQAGKDRSKEEILERNAKHKFNGSAEENLLNAMQEWGDQEVAKVHKQMADMNRNLSEEYDGLKQARDYITTQYQLKDKELQTLRDNNSKLVEAAINLNSELDAVWNRPKHARFSEDQTRRICDAQKKLGQALQSITQQDNKQEGI